jgi:tetratricopeptide (TPR) repeat protein
MRLAEQANVHRRAGEWERAAELFRAAHEALPENVQGLELARVLVIESSFDRDRMHFAAALRKLAKAHGIFRLRRCCAVDLARCEIIRGIVYDDMGEYEDAQDEHLAAIGRLPRGHSLRAPAMYGIIEAALCLGQRQRAREWFESVRPTATVMELDGDPLGHRIKVDWVEAQLWIAEGELMQARRRMTGVVEHYLGPAPHALSSARALVDLAECSARLGFGREVEGATAMMADLFAVLGLREEEATVRLLLARLASRHACEAAFGVVLAARSAVRVHARPAVRLGTADER